MTTKETSSGGIGFFGLLTIVFVTLKLCNVIQWSWWLVLLPLYGPIILGLIGILVFCVVVVWSTWAELK